MNSNIRLSSVHKNDKSTVDEKSKKICQCDGKCTQCSCKIHKAGTNPAS